jgi:DNA-3-methyladenine glycosylase
VATRARSKGSASVAKTVAPRAATTIAALRETRMPASWFQRESFVVARELVGTVLVHGRRAGVIVETEAYTGPEDRASHARFGRTARTSIMFGPGGYSYVYLCYGVHEMFNIVTGPDGHGQAVLIRAIAPFAGLVDDPSVGRGPGKVTRALAIDRRHYGRDLTKGALFVAAPVVAPALATWRDVPALAVATGPRIGVAYAGESAALPLRFWWRDHPAVSKGPTVKPAKSS